MAVTGGLKRAQTEPIRTEAPCLCPGDCAVRTQETSSLHYKSKGGEVIHPRTCRKPVAECSAKGGFLALSPQFCFTRYNPHSWTSVLRNQSRNSVPVPEPPSGTVCLVPEGMVLAVLPPSVSLVGDYGEEGSYITQMMPFEADLWQPPALLSDTMRVGRGQESPDRSKIF